MINNFDDGLEEFLLMNKDNKKKIQDKEEENSMDFVMEYLFLLAIFCGAMCLV